VSYQVLARKWRPRGFGELIGQEHVVRPLVNALDSGRLHHAFLFTGTRGVGKTTVARILAKSLNCETGVTSKPCGTCSACREVDEGRFVDLIEVDAASRTKVDDTRELLDNVQYAPTRGRYKVYLIDEVHMLSGHSFNALLKTLEEPPPHVKFLLATTDPQKLPVTVLSRCLQFSLKRLLPEQIEAQFLKILKSENIDCEAASLALLARAADGSVRDGLSLLDQAIVYGGGRVKEADVRAMLGTIDHGVVEQILSALATQDAPALMQGVANAAEFGADFSMLLDELMLALHRIALAHTDPKLLSATEATAVQAHASTLSPEDVQLYYQIALHGKRDLPLAPDPRTGLQMCLIRMLAFRPAPVFGANPVPNKTTASLSPTPSAAVSASPPTKPNSLKDAAKTPSASGAPGDWSEIVAQLKVAGLVRELANHSVLESMDETGVQLILNETYGATLSREREAALRVALEAYYGRALNLSIRVAKPTVETPAQQKTRAQDQRQQAAVQAIAEDPNVLAIQNEFNARVNPGSIRPAGQE
jgi:DNA polymerase-3 subunit gamma/tau